MSVLVNIPGWGIISVDSQGTADKLNEVLDILRLEGTINHTNLDSRAVGSKIDPFNVDDISKMSLKGPMGFLRAKLQGYTDAEWDTLFGNVNFNPATSVNYKDSTSSVIDANAIATTKARQNMPVITESRGGEVTMYTVSEWNNKYPQSSNIIPSAFQNGFPPGNYPPVDWDCNNHIVDLTNTCISCSQIECDSCTAGGLTPTVGNPGCPGTTPQLDSRFHKIFYISDPLNGLQNTPCDLIRWRTCSTQPSTTLCTTDDGLYGMGVIKYFGLMSIPAQHYLAPMNDYVYTEWSLFIADLISIGYTGTPTDSFEQLLANFAADPTLPTPGQWNTYGAYISIVVHACVGFNGCGPVVSPPNPPPTPFLTNCDVNCTNYQCTNATGQCQGSSWVDNGDGSIVWRLAFNPPYSSGANTMFLWEVTDAQGTTVNSGVYDGAAGTITVAIGNSSHSWFVANDFTSVCWTTDNLLPGDYTINILNFVGGGNPYGNLSIGPVTVLGNTPIPCTTTSTDEPDPDCPCEGAANCEECGDNGINFKS